MVGKPLGTLAGARLSVRVVPGQRLALSWPVIAGGGVIAGIGFTVSLLIAGIAFHGERLAEAKVGVLAAALIASLGGWA